MPQPGNRFGLHLADISLRRRGGNRLALFPTWSSAYSGSGRRRILLIHGYNVTEDRGVESMERFRDDLAGGCLHLRPTMFTVTWPGDLAWYEGGAASYMSRIGVADKAGELLWTFLKQDYDDGGGAEELVLVAHSLGCRVALRCLAAMTGRRPERLKRLIVIMMAPAVPTDETPLLAPARSTDAAIEVLHSTGDTVLKFFFRIGQTLGRADYLPEAIGYAGNPTDPAWSFQRAMQPYEHGDYWGGSFTADVIGESLKHYFDDIFYRPTGRRDRTIAERARLAGTSQLPEHQLELF